MGVNGIVLFLTGIRFCVLLGCFIELYGIFQFFALSHLERWVVMVYEVNKHNKQFIKPVRYSG